MNEQFYHAEIVLHERVDKKLLGRIWFKVVLQPDRSTNLKVKLA